MTEAKIQAVFKPTIKQLNRFVIPKVAHKWRNLGLQLLGDDEARTLNLYTGGNRKCCSEMLRDWLERSPKADWYILVAALESPLVKLDNVAGEIKSMFTGSQCTSDSFTNISMGPRILKYCAKAAQYPESNFAEEYEKKSESFCLYPADINKPFLRSIEMINDDQSEKLKRHIEDSFNSLNHHLQSKLAELFTNKQQDVKEIIEEQNQQLYEDHKEVVDQIKNQIIQLLARHKQESLRVVQNETNALKQELDENVERQQAENRNLLTSYNNSQIETKAYLRIIIIMLIVTVFLLLYTLLKIHV